MTKLPAYLQKQVDEIDQKINQNQILLNDPQLKSLAKEEINALKTQKKALLSTQSSTQASNSSKNTLNSKTVLIEVRSGAGGEEAKIWAQDLLEMYQKFAEAKNFKTTKIDSLVIQIKGQDAYQLLQHEAGVHRVQRIPTTESRGRIHTSTATVAVLPEISQSQIKIDPKDVSISFYRSGGAGGQNVNKVNTAVRLHHQPSGITVESQTQRYQEQNRKIAMQILRSKLWQIEQDKQAETISKARSAIGRAMRAEKIRTYNYPQNRVTDHRIQKSYKNLDKILEGNLDKLIKALLTHFSQS